MLKLLVPRFPLRQLPAMLAIAAAGALAASEYGIVHDQLTYALSPEYFTRLKFQNFSSLPGPISAGRGARSSARSASWQAGGSAWSAAGLWPARARLKCRRVCVVLASRARLASWLL
jgi:hypothetical protein